MQPVCRSHINRFVVESTARYANGQVILGVRLTKREGQVLALLLEGKSDKEVASVLKVSVRTVRFHIGNIFKKKGVATRAELLSQEFSGKR